MKELLITNTSDGKSSMAQAIIIKEQYCEEYETICLFSNTGMENEETLEFIDKCDREYNLNVVWLEAVVHEHGKGNTHRVTNFKDAYRIEQYKDPLHPFHAHIRKNGIPNATYPQCSDRLKEQVIESYKKANGLKGVKQALGMRIDESNRATSKTVREALLRFGVGDGDFRVTDNHLERMFLIMNSRKLSVNCEKDMEVIERYSLKLKKIQPCIPYV